MKKLKYEGIISDESKRTRRNLRGSLEGIWSRTVFNIINQIWISWNDVPYVHCSSPIFTTSVPKGENGPLVRVDTWFLQALALARGKSVTGNLTGGNRATFWIFLAQEGCIFQVLAWQTRKLPEYSLDITFLLPDTGEHCPFFLTYRRQGCCVVWKFRCRNSDGKIRQILEFLLKASCLRALPHFNCWDAFELFIISNAWKHDRLCNSLCHPRHDRWVFPWSTSCRVPFEVPCFGSVQGTPLLWLGRILNSGMWYLARCITISHATWITPSSVSLNHGLKRPSKPIPVVILSSWSTALELAAMLLNRKSMAWHLLEHAAKTSPHTKTST